MRSLRLLLITAGLVWMACPTDASHRLKAADEAAPLAEIREWRVVLIDGEAMRPLPGIHVNVQVNVPNERQQQARSLVSDDQGRLEIPLRRGEGTSVHVRGPGWCLPGEFSIVGELPAEWLKLDPNLRQQSPDKLRTIKLYKGVDVRGRLLRPDGEPAAGVRLHAGVHCNSPPWISQAYIDNLMSHSFSVSEWSNWHGSSVVADDGSFSITVPPDDARGWIRIGTTRGGWEAIETIWLEENEPDHALVRFAPFQVEINGSKSQQIAEVDGILELGDLQLPEGITVQGRVVDAEGRPLAGVHLLTSSVQGPYAGRKTASRADGSYEFMPMNIGTFRLSPDAHPRGEGGEKNSRDVQAVFVSQQVTLDGTVNPLELEVRALPHVNLEFEWIDRRVAKGPVSFYGGFRLTGQVPRGDGTLAHWQSETVKEEHGDRVVLRVKTPKDVVDLKIALHPDQRVTPSYHDERVERATGQVELGDISAPMRRVIYGDEPTEK